MTLTTVPANTRRALLTGATSDLGQAIARALVADGWSLILTGRDHARLASLAREVGGDARPGDLSDAAFRASLVPDDPARAITGFVHAASHRFTYQRFHLVPAEEVEKQCALDRDAPIELLQRALPEMVAHRHGRIVLLSSLAASLAGQGAALYAAHKAGLEGLVRALALEYGRFGITANAVAPGFIATSRLAERAGADAQERFANATALKRIADPSEIAAVVAFLMSPAASYVTGITLPVTGGAHLNTLW